MTGALHGLALRVASLAAKLGMLVWVLPGLPEGEVTRFLLLTTAGAFAGRLLALGLEDELPLVVRGEPAVARRLLALSGWPLVASGLLGAAALAAGPGAGAAGTALVVGCGALALTSTNLLGGLARTLSPALVERLGSFPALLLLLAALVAPGLDAARLVLLGAAAQAVCVVGTALAAGLLARPAGAPPPSGELVALQGRLGAGAAKLASNLLLLLQVRALGWAPAALGRPPDDALSLAVLVGEAGLQLGYVVALRHYAGYARGEGTAGLAVRRALAGWGALGGAGALVAALLALGATALLPGRAAGLDLGGAPWALAQAGALLATVQARFFFWSRGAPAGPQLATQAAWLVAVGGVLLAVPQGGWLVATTAATSLVAVATLVRLARAAGP